ncbi:MAG: ABC transporter ATP-binding protein [Planctomycetota bacterium]|nr:ABC transporter ATP-binding protein [Planctomycetota bacterium]
MIVIEKLTAHSGQFTLKDASFVVPTGTYGMLMGRTGSGKTTILETIAGLKQVTGGRILLGDRDVTGLKPAERNIGYVPQDGALFSTMTVREHLSFALDIRRVSRPQIDERVAELAELLEIEDLLHRLPRGLSGGEKQRVAIGRALAFRPSTLLLDEPLSALDDDTRNQLYSLLKHVQEHTGVTTLHVTHHMYDVMQLADKLFRIEDGVVTEQPVNGKPSNRNQS